MKIKAAGITAIIMFLNAPPAFAQVAYDTSQLDQRADVERNRILLRSTLRQKERWDASHRNPSRTQAQASACADRPRFHREYGPDHPKVRRAWKACARKRVTDGDS